MGKLKKKEKEERIQMNLFVEQEQTYRLKKLWLPKGTVQGL